MDLKQEIKYPADQKGKWYLLKPVLIELDLQLRNKCQLFLKMSSAERAQFRQSIHVVTQWTLCEFAKRSSVFSLREQDPNLLTTSFQAMAMVPGNRLDPRDLLTTLGTLKYAAKRLNLDRDTLFRDAVTTADSRMGEFLRESGQRPIEVVQGHRGWHRENSWGFWEVTTDAGIGFVDADSKRYEPQSDLLDEAMRVASAIEQDNLYATTELQIGTEPNDCWLQHSEGSDLSPLIAKSTGCVLVRANMDRNQHPQAQHQSFLAYVMEMETGQSAQEFLEISQTPCPPNFARLGVRRDKLFNLVIARSYVTGVVSVEDTVSLKRFEKPIYEQMQ